MPFLYYMYDKDSKEAEIIEVFGDKKSVTDLEGV